MDSKKIQVILDDLENFDQELYQHSEHVAMLCYAAAQELNLSYSEREMAYFSGLLHDVGRFYLESNEHEDFEDESIVNGSMIYFDKDFNKLIPIIVDYENINEEDSEKYDFCINIIKVIVKLSNEYDEFRSEGLSHEKSCQMIRENNVCFNNMVTILLKAIIKNKLNYEY